MKHNSRASVYFTSFQDTIIFLDIKRNQYYSFETPNSSNLLQLLDALSISSSRLDQPKFELTLKAVEMLDVEISKDILIRLAPRGDAKLPTRDAFGYRGSTVKPTFKHLLRLTAACAKIRILFPLLPFEFHVRRIKTRRARNQAEDCPVDDTLHREVEIFLKLRPLFYKARDHCLYDSLVLLEFLAQVKKFPKLAIGVRSNPFAAHAWVQAEDCLLNDYFHTATHTKPILSI